MPLSTCYAQSTGGRRLVPYLPVLDLCGYSGGRDQPPWGPIAEERLDGLRFRTGSGFQGLDIARPQDFNAQELAVRVVIGDDHTVFDFTGFRHFSFAHSKVYGHHSTIFLVEGCLQTKYEIGHYPTPFSLRSTVTTTS